MPYITVTIQVTSDLASGPALVYQKIRRVFVTEAQVINMSKAGSDGVGTFTTVPTISQAATLNAIVLDTTGAALFKLNSVVNADGVISLKAGGVLLALDCNVASGATTNATVNNVPASATQITGFAGGT